MCGNVICGRTNPDLPFFTKSGSFWTNSTTELLASTTEADCQARLRNRCNGEGYESVALVPLRTDRATIGLLQFNDRRPGRFTPELIHFFEGLGASIGIALHRKQMTAQLKDALRERIDFQPYLERLANNIHLGFSKTPVTVAVDAGGVFLDVQTAIPCGLIVAELMTNAFKHAFPPDREGNRIRVEMRRENAAFALTVMDNGVGLPPAFDVQRAKTLGVSLVRSWATHQLKGNISLDRRHGTLFTKNFTGKKGKSA